MWQRQNKSVASMPKTVNLKECRSTPTPVEEPFMPCDDATTEVANTHCRSAVGSLIYIMMATRPDYSYCVGFWSQFLNNQTDVHWKGVKRVPAYLQGIKQHGLLCQKESTASLIGYIDADYGTSRDGKLISGNVFYISFRGPARSKHCWCSLQQRPS